nr:MAG TPA: hypothetical protein [Caudoviricetes sp.]DAQ00030.1 MAG TPA: hypothetical protein [Caudoviricetes sp.]
MTISGHLAEYKVLSASSRSSNDFLIVSSSLT